jgi:hypothetical protein
MPNYNKWGVGQINQARDLNGKLIYRANKLFMMVGETIQEVDCVYDPEHFLYQNVMPVTKVEYENYQKTIGYIPRERLGNHGMCTCGAEAVIILDPNAPPDWNGKAICRSVAQFGIHQTDMIIKDGKATLPDKIAQDKIMTQAEYDRQLKGEE